MQQNRPFDEGFVWHVLHDVGKGLAYLHGGITDAARQTHSQRGWDMICHLDIKPANIFMSSRGSDGTYPRMVLGDFGCAVTRRDIESGREEPQNHRHGTLDWMPPHSRGDVVGPRNRGYGWHTDVWQLGAVAAAMCRLTHAPILAHVFTDHVAPCGSGYGAKLNAVVRGCVRKNWRRRPKAVEIVRTVLKR